MAEEFPHNFPNDLRLKKDLKKLGDIKTNSNLVRDTAKWPVSIPDFTLWQQQSKKLVKVNIKLFQFSNFTGCLYFILAILSKLNFSHNKAETH